MRLETLPLSEVKPYWRNPRNNEGGVAAVKQSIREYGFNVPLVIDTANTIIAGHTRYKALMQLGVDEVPCVVLDIGQEKAKEYRIADNKTSELSGWDLANLIPELRELDTERMDAFFPDEDLDKLVDDSVGLGSYSPPTQEQIDERGAALETDFEDKNRKDLAGYVELACPECGETFAVQKEDFLKRADG